PGPDDGRRLSHLLGWLHFPLLGLSVWAVAQGGPLWSSALLVIAAGLFFGQISNSNAHELIHRRDRGAFRLGAAVYTSLLFGHHTSAHRLVHHVHAATPLDPASAPGGRGFWAYLPRAWVGGFRAGLRAERQRAGGQMWPAPYRAYILGAFCSLMAAYTLGGVRGLAALL
ncbi:MAG: fatty acid desaturase, partial [Pseudomonadota bacterium]